MKKIMLIITLFLLTIPTVFADQVTLVKNRIEDIYTYYYDKNLGRDRFLYANRYTFGDTPAYCLELGKAIDSNIYTYTTSFEELNIDKNILDYVKLIAYYGYDYPGHDTDNYYMAAQELIWNNISDDYVEWVIKMTPSSIVDISKEKNEIMSLINNHYQKPSFDNKEIQFVLGEELIIEDNNNILDRYVTTSNNVAIEGNKIIIKENFTEEEIILKHPNYNGKQFLLYTSGLSQKMLSTGTVDDVTSKVKIKLVGGSIKINKLDKDTKSSIPQGEGILKGAVYELYDENNNLVDTIVTGTKDKIENLSLGKYTLKEKEASSGYKLDNNIYTIEITKDNLNTHLDVYEEVIKRKVEIFKVLAGNITGELTPEPNVNFNIYDKNNVIVDTITTDSNGYANITLPYGKYTFKQTTTTENYNKVDDFTIIISEYDERPIYKLLADSEITAKVKIIKKDFTTKENILNSNIKFKIFDVKNNKYLSLKVSYPENKVTEEFQVDKNGIFITPIALSPGEYIIEEVKESMDGYLYNNEKIKFKIDASTNFIKEDNEVYLEIPFYNQRVKGTINIVKYGEELTYKDNIYNYKEIPLEKVTFHLYAREDIYENGQLIYSQDDLVKELITGAEGTISEENLPLGKYYLKEINTSNNHILDETIYAIDLSYEDEETSIITQNLKIKNYLPKGRIVINKYQKGTTTPISNTLIEVCTKDNTIIYKGYTDQNGQIILEELPYGEYYLSEIESATGYRLLEDKITFEISKEEKTINIYNERITVPNTGFSLTSIDIFVILVIFLGIVLVTVFSKEKSIAFLAIIIIIFGIIYFVIIIYKYYDDNKNNKKSVEAYINNKIDTITEEKYQYNSILEIPSINLKRGILDINNKYNKAKYNIELVKEEDSIIVLAAHNGTNRNSYFGNLNTIELGDEINYYRDGHLYKYIYSESYDIKKNGYADIYRNEDIQSIILITCKDNTDDAQTVYIGYLKDISSY